MTFPANYLKAILAAGIAIGAALLALAPGEATAAKHRDPQSVSVGKPTAKPYPSRSRHRVRHAKARTVRAPPPTAASPIMLPVMRPTLPPRPVTVTVTPASVHLTGVTPPSVGATPVSVTVPVAVSSQVAAADSPPDNTNKPPAGAQGANDATGLASARAEANLFKADANAQRTLVARLQSEVAQFQTQVADLTGVRPLFDKYIEVKKREYDFQSAMMTVNERNFFHQIVASYVILAMVVIVVGSALYFAYVQLMAGVVRPLATEGATVAGAATPTAEAGSNAVTTASATPLSGQTTLDLSYQKVTVSSSVVGIIVLVISLAFLYIYTREIFHLELVDPYKPKLTTPSDTGKSAKSDEKPTSRMKSGDD